MTRDAFWHLHDCICNDPIFISTSNRPQRPVKYQLATFLCRMGAESALKTACVMSIAEGTVYLYCSRVCRAFRNIRDEHLAWPGDQRRGFLSHEMSEWGFPGCIGIGDGSYVHLVNRPIRNGYAFWCQKKCYAVRNSDFVDRNYF